MLFQLVALGFQYGNFSFITPAKHIAAAIVDAVMLIADEVVAANAAVTALQAAPVVLSAVYPSMPAGLVAKAGTGVTITIGAPTLGDIEFKV